MYLYGIIELNNKIYKFYLSSLNWIHSNWLSRIGVNRVRHKWWLSFYYGWVENPWCYAKKKTMV